MNILASSFIQPLFHALNFDFGSFFQKFDEILNIFQTMLFFRNPPNKFTKPLTKTAAFQFFRLQK